jgi:hypothetical protein
MAGIGTRQREHPLSAVLTERGRNPFSSDALADIADGLRVYRRLRRPPTSIMGLMLFILKDEKPITSSQYLERNEVGLAPQIVDLTHLHGIHDLISTAFNVL